MWFNNATFHTLQEWIANELEKTILTYYFNPKDRYQKIRNLRKYMLQKAATNNILNALEIPLSKFEKGFLQEKNKMTETIKGYEESMRDRLQ